MQIEIQDGITILARCDHEDGVWPATSEQVPGLIIEAETLAAVISEVNLVLPDLLELSAR